MSVSGSPPTRSASAPPLALRWISASICILYGFAKINGSQFTILESELSRPLGEVSGFWLTWYYFGYSPVYGTAIALAQIGAGALLVLPRFALAGALILLPLATNIVLIDIFYGVDLGGTFMAVVLLLCVIAMIAPHSRRLWDAVVLSTFPARPGVTGLVMLVLILSGAWAFTWWGAHYNNRAPTAIDGVWSVTSSPESTLSAPPWRQVFFEYNRARMAVFRSDGHRDEVHHFEIDAAGVVRIWDVWLRKGDLLMQGRRRSETEIELEIVHGDRRGTRVLLRRTR